MIYSLLAGAAASPVILHVPHASRALSDRARDGLLIGDGDLSDELDHLTDAHTDLIARQAASSALVRPWVFENQWSRLVVDPERFPDDTEEMRAVGMGAVYTHGYARRRLRSDDPERDALLIEEHFRPYAAGMASLVGDRLAATGRAVIVDVHSYATSALPYELHGAGERPQICLGTDAVHTPRWLLSAAERAFSAYGIGLNSPFAGCYVPLRYHRVDRNVSALMIEIRRDVYMAEPGGSRTAGLDRVGAALGALVDGLQRADT